MTDVKLPPLPEAKYDLASRSNGYSDARILNWDGYSDEQMTEYGRLAVLQERERCAKVCESLQEPWKKKVLLGFVGVLQDASDAIRKGE